MAGSSTAAGRCRYWHDDIGAAFGRLMQGVDAFLWVAAPTKFMARRSSRCRRAIRSAT